MRKLTVGSTTVQVLAIPDDGVVLVVGGQDVVVLVDILVLPVDGQTSNGAVSSRGVSVVIDRRSIGIAPTNIHIQRAGLLNRKVVGVIEGGAVSVGLKGRLVALQLVPVTGVLSMTSIEKDAKLEGDEKPH